MCNNNNNAILVENLGTYPWEIHKIQKRREESLVCVSFLDILFVSYYLDTMTLSSLSLRVNGRQWLICETVKHMLPWTEVTGDLHNLSNRHKATGTLLDV